MPDAPTVGSSSISTAVQNGAGENTTLALQAEGLSGITNTALGGFASFAAIGSNGSATIGGSLNAAPMAQGTFDGPGAAIQLVTADASAIKGSLVVGPQEVTAFTDPGTPASVTVRNDLGFHTTLTANPQTGSTAFVNQVSNRKSEFYGVGIMANNQGDQEHAVRCVVPVPISLGGTNAVYCHLEILMIAKCVIASSGIGVGASRMQKGYSPWINIGGTFTAQTTSVDDEGNVISYPIFVATIDRGTSEQNLGFYDVNVITTVVAGTPGSNTLIVSAQPTDGSIINPGSVIELFVTAYYN